MNPELREEICRRIAAVGWCEMSRRTGIDRIQLYRLFRWGRGSFRIETLNRVLPHVGMKLTIVEAD